MVALDGNSCWTGFGVLKFMFGVTTGLDGWWQGILAAQGHKLNKTPAVRRRFFLEPLQPPEKSVHTVTSPPSTLLMSLPLFLWPEKAFITSKSSVIDSSVVIKGRFALCSWNFRIEHKQHGKIITDRPGLHNFHIKYRGKFHFAQFSSVNVFLSDNQLIVQAPDYNVGGTCNNHRVDLLASNPGVYSSRPTKNANTDVELERAHRHSRQQPKGKKMKMCFRNEQKIIFRRKTFLCSIEDGNKQLNLYLIQSFTRWHSCQMKETFFRVPASLREENTLLRLQPTFSWSQEMKQKSEHPFRSAVGGFRIQFDSNWVWILVMIW